MNDEIKQNIKIRGTWTRLFFMLVFTIIYMVAEVVLTAVVVIQFFFVLLSTKANPQLLRLGAQLSEFIRQILLYLTFNTEERPFPFADWPQPEQSATAKKVSRPKRAAKPKRAVTKKTADLKEPESE